MTSNATIWTTANPIMEFDTMMISHSSFDPVYVVFNQYDPVTLNGNEYLPCYGEITYPVVDGETTPEVQVDMARALVGDEIEALIKSIPPWKRMVEPVIATFQHWSEENGGTLMFGYELNISSEGVSMSIDSVTIKAQKLNQMTRSVARLYEITEWPGLQNT